jgi:hypothetical protein
MHEEQVKDVLAVHRFKFDDQWKWLPQGSVRGKILNSCLKGHEYYLQ